MRSPPRHLSHLLVCEVVSLRPSQVCRLHLSSHHNKTSGTKGEASEESMPLYGSSAWNLGPPRNSLGWSGRGCRHQRNSNRSTSQASVCCPPLLRQPWQAPPHPPASRPRRRSCHPKVPQSVPSVQPRQQRQLQELRQQQSPRFHFGPMPWEAVCALMAALAVERLPNLQQNKVLVPVGIIDIWFHLLLGGQEPVTTAPP